MGKNSRRGSGHFHAVRFYKDADSLCQLVGAYLAEGFRVQQPAIVIATPSHRACILEQLRSQDVDPVALAGPASLVLLDAEEMLEQFMIDGTPDTTKFRTAMEPVLRSLSEAHPGAQIRAYGEMVDVLWKQGRTVAATRLEMLWNDLAQGHDFALLCGYAMGNFYKGTAVEAICSHHSHVVSSEGTATLLN